MGQDFSNLLNQSAAAVAPLLLGSILEREIDGHLLRAKIVETEAYDQTDTASHSYKGKTLRNKIMFGQPGCLYVYFTYGMHYCCNVVTGAVGDGSAVLIRAVEPLEGGEYMEMMRHRSGVDISNGPAKLCQALGIDMRLNGHNLLNEPLQLMVQPSLDRSVITQTTRIGISKAIDLPLRFYINGNNYVSKP